MMMAALYNVSVPAINQHLKRIFADNELERGPTVKKYLIVQTEGNLEVRREIEQTQSFPISENLMREKT